MSREEVHEVVTKMGEEYKGNLYHLLQRNCNHFSEDFAYRLCQAKTPNWVSRSLNQRLTPRSARHFIQQHNFSWSHLTIILLLCAFLL